MIHVDIIEINLDQTAKYNIYLHKTVLFCSKCLVMDCECVRIPFQAMLLKTVSIRTVRTLKVY